MTKDSLISTIDTGLCVWNMYGAPRKAVQRSVGCTFLLDSSKYISKIVRCAIPYNQPNLFNLQMYRLNLMQWLRICNHSFGGLFASLAFWNLYGPAFLHSIHARKIIILCPRLSKLQHNACLNTLLSARQNIILLRKCTLFCHHLRLHC